eukprot:9845769-Prorocentrum_lima.AAC.1
MDVRSDTPTEVAASPTEVADSSSTPVGPPAPTDPAAALQQQLERCQDSLTASLQRTLAEAEAHMQTMVEGSIAATLSSLPELLLSSIQHLLPGVTQ